MRSKEAPRHRLDRGAILEAFGRGGYAADCDIRPSKHNRFICYRTVLVRYRTTASLTVAPDQPSPVATVDGTTSGGRQIGAAARTTGSIQNRIPFLPMGDLCLQRLPVWNTEFRLRKLAGGGNT